MPLCFEARTRLINLLGCAGDALATNSTLTSLCLGDAEFGDASLEVLCAGLKLNKGVRTFLLTSGSTHTSR